MNTTAYPKLASVLVGITIAFARQLIAQGFVEQWVKRYNAPANYTDLVHAIAVGTNGNVYVAGESWDEGSGSQVDFVTIAYTTSGTPLWTNRYDGPGGGVDRANAIATDLSGNVFVTGASYGGPSSTHDFATIAYSSSGVPQWTNRYDGPANYDDQAQAIAVDSSGNVFVTGYSSGTGSSYDYATVAYSNSGTPLWTNRYNGTANNQDFARAIIVDNSGNLVATGSSTGPGSSSDYATVCYSNSGIPQWTNRYNGPGNNADEARALAVGSNGTIIVTGYSQGGATARDYATIAYSGTGTPLWTNRYKGSANTDDEAFAMVVTTNGNIFVTGFSTVVAGILSEFATVAYSGGGLPLWTNTYRGAGTALDQATCIAKGDNGNIYVTGQSAGSGSGWDFATVAYSNAGLPLWTNRYNGSANSVDQARAMAVDRSGNIFVTGDSVGTNSDYDFATIKYSPVFAPEITVQPESSTNVAGATASFTLSATGTEPLYYQWRHEGTNLLNGGNISGATTNQLVLTDIQPTDAGSYDIVVTNLYGAVTSIVAELTVPSCVLPPSGLVAWWRGESNALDTANTNHGTLVSGATFAPGEVGTGFQTYPGFVRVADAPELQPDQVTVSAWVRADAPPPDFSYILSKSFDVNGASYAMYGGGSPTGGGLVFYVTHPNLQFTFSPATGPGIWDNQFHHVVGSYDGQFVRMFVDGVEIGSGTPDSGAIGYGSQLQNGDLLIGSYYTDRTDTRWPGLVDEVAIFNRALSSNEFATLYATGSAGMCAPHCEFQPPDLVAWWRAESNLLDSLGTNNATQSGGVSFVPGKREQGINFNGSGSFVVVPDSDSLKPTNDFSIEVWLRSSGTPPYSGVTIKFDEFPFNTGFELTFQGNGQKLTGIVGVGGGAYTGFSNPQTVTDGQWHHAVATFSSSALILYIDGVAGNPVTPTGFAPISQSQLTFGNDPCCGGRNFTGDLDEIRFYHRALTSNEVAALYLAGFCGRPSILRQPQSRTNYVGTFATFEVAAGGSDPLAYQWQRAGTNLFDGGNVSGTTTAQLLLNNVQFSDTAEYRVIVSNDYGAVTSVIATMTVTTNIFWTGAISSDWNNPTNWNPQQVPTASDHVVVDSSNSGGLTMPSDASFAVLDWSGGYIYGALTVASNATLNLTGGTYKSLGGVLTNFGTVDWSGGDFNLPNAARVYNFGLWDIQADPRMLGGSYSPYSAFNNTGTVRKSAGSGTAYLGHYNSPYNYIAFANAGAVEAQVGTITFYGDFAQAPSASLAASLGGTTPNSDYGHIQFNAPLTMDGSFGVSLRNGFRPNPGDTFNVLSYPSATNEFACLSGLDLEIGLLLLPQFTPTSLSLLTTTYTTNASQPQLFITRSPESVRLTWPLGFPSWVLETTTNLDLPVWSPLSYPCDNQATVPIGEPAQFFRLKQ